MDRRRDLWPVRRPNHTEYFAVNADSPNPRPDVRMHGRSIWRCRRHPILRRLKQVTDVVTTDALADLESTAVDIVANRREPSRATGQWHVNGLVPQRLYYVGWVRVHEGTARGGDQKSCDEKQAAVRCGVFGQHPARLDTGLPISDRDRAASVVVKLDAGARQCNMRDRSCRSLIHGLLGAQLVVIGGAVGTLTSFATNRLLRSQLEVSASHAPGHALTGGAVSTGSASETYRLETFADAVFAIAITLLIIEIRLPAGEKLEHLGGLGPALRHLWPSYLGYVISFIVIGIMWANHPNLMKLLDRIDHGFITLNLLLLMCVAFLPFPTAIMAEHLTDPQERGVAVAFYCGCFTITAVFYFLMWWHAARDRRLIASDVPDEAVRAITRAYAPGSVLYPRTTLLAFVHVAISLSIVVGLAILCMLPRAGAHAAAVKTSHRSD
jgi:uncharacterized membrane protein